MKNTKEVLTFGFAYSCVIALCLYGPLMEIITEGDPYKHAIISLLAFVIAFLNPYLNKIKKDIVIIALYSSLALLFLQKILILEKIAVFIFSFLIATICRSFTLHVLDKVEVDDCEMVMSHSFFISFLLLYIINVLKPNLSRIQGLIILVGISVITTYYYKITINNKSLQLNSLKLRKNILLPLVSLYLVNIGGGISYAGIYPYLDKFYDIDRFYNVLPLVIFMPIAGLLGKKYGNLINLFLGIIFLSISFMFFMFPHTLYNYLFIQTFLQIGWAFTNVFGFSYSWRLADKYKKPSVFGYGILFILLGVISGSIIANFIVERNLPLIYFGPFTLIPLIMSLIFQFLYSDIKIIEFKRSIVEQNSEASKQGTFFKLEILDQLTNREKEIIYYYYNSLTAVNIAEKLNLSPNTVRSHIKNSYAKLKINKRDDLKDLINKTL